MTTPISHLTTNQIGGPQGPDCCLAIATLLFKLT